MTDSPTITASIINDLIISLDLLKQGKDEYFSLEEFALGQPLLKRDIDLCYGYAKVPATTNTLAAFEAVIGKGLARITTDDVEAKLAKPSVAFTGINFTDQLPADTKYQNVYAFANVFISRTDGGVVNSPEASILKGENTGTPIFMLKDLDIDTLLAMSNNDEIPDAEGPADPYIKIFNVIIEINYYDPNDSSTKDVIIHFIDKRKPRGWGGFAEEFMGVYLTPYIINKNTDYNKIYKSIDQNIYNLVSNWINLRFWDPSFIDFWQNPINNDLMPLRLKQYLNLRFSIIL
ncbi:MAG: hypothetical protein RLZZ196_838 [Bacteroidota bacterium]|jgi:hypothetical protein